MCLQYHNTRKQENYGGLPGSCYRMSQEKPKEVSIDQREGSLIIIKDNGTIDLYPQHQLHEFIMVYNDAQEKECQLLFRMLEN